MNGPVSEEEMEQFNKMMEEHNATSAIWVGDGEMPNLGPKCYQLNVVCPKCGKNGIAKFPKKSDGWVADHKALCLFCHEVVDTPLWIDGVDVLSFDVGVEEAKKLIESERIGFWGV